MVTLLFVDGKEISSAPQLQEQIGIHRPGDKLRFIFIRNGHLKTTMITLQDFSNRHQKKPDQFVQQLDESNNLAHLGIDIQSIEEGIRIHSIMENGLIDQTNMEEGFIVQQINEQEVNSVDDFYTMILSGDSDIKLDGYYSDYQGEFQYIFQLDK